MKPLISIGIPVKNGFKYESYDKTNIKNVLDSILNQTYENLEIIISDDCSNDETRKYLDEVSKIDKRIRLFFQKENLGWEKNFKFVLDNSKGEFFKWNAQDDIISKDYIEKNYTFLNENSEYVACSSKFNYENKPDQYKFFNLDQNLFHRIKNFFKYRHISHNLFHSLIRMKNIRNTIDLSKKYWAIDWIIDLDLLFQGKFKTIEDGLVRFGVHGASKKKEYKRKENLSNKKIYKIFPFYELMKHVFLRTYGLKKLSIMEKISIYVSLIKINLYLFKKKIEKK